jgi:hypothetical protein
VIVALPALTPVTTPAASTVATAALLLVQLPPVEALDRVVVKPAQVVVVPVIAPTVGVLFTVNVVVTIPVPQVPVTA